MPRVRWCSFPLPVLCLLGLFFWISSVFAVCWYDDENHEEGAEVATAEPCLNCTCSKGALLCYLRVCPRLPNPPPPGCILLHRYRTCCPELICTEIFGGSNGLEARSEPDGIDIPYERTTLKNACVVNGSIYAPGSAMDSSSLCEYCYCLGGKQTCVKPKCLLPIEGCVPMYEETNCCPVHYNCTYITPIISSTTTMKPKEIQSRKGGCVVDGVYYNEGGKVLGVGHSVCDNCYCLRGILRCEPLSCAPPLLGCTPVIRPGECCAASYNCSGTIEIQPEPNYGEFPIVSKEYAKLRKQVQQIPIKANRKQSTENSNIPFYVIAESSQTTTKIHRGPGTFGTTRHFTGISINPSTIKPLYYNSMMEENLSTIDNKHSTRSYVQNKLQDVSTITSDESQNNNHRKSHSTTTKPRNTEHNTFRTTNSITTTDYKDSVKSESSDYLDFSDETLLSIVDSLLDSRLNRRVETKNYTGINNNTTTETTQTTSDSITTTGAVTETEIYDTSTVDFSTTTADVIIDTTDSPLHPMTLKTILNSTDCTNGNDTSPKQQNLEITTVLPIDANEINKLAEVKNSEDLVITSSEESSVETTTNEVITEMSLESKVAVVNATLRSIPKVPLEIETILNITKEKDSDYEYDYNEPSLPPSLPNLRIIPFVAADALDSKNDKHNVIYSPQERVTDIPFTYTNLFSPPIETEGGFIPKQPPILDNFYENAVTSTSIANTPNLHEVSCISEGREVNHGQVVASESACVTCSCFYGNIICQKTPCPIPRLGCRKSSVQDISSCCPHYVCDDEEAPTVVLDRLEGTSNSQEVVTVAEGVNTPDPFRDVIRTEPAPDLQSLIVDMMPYLARKTTPILYTTIKSTNPESPSTTVNDTTTTHSNDDGLSLDRVLQLLLFNQNEETQEIKTEQIQTLNNHPTADSTTKTLSPSVDDKIKLQTSTPVPLTKLETREDSNDKDLHHPNSVDSTSPGMAILKLAGCNIYGRMYRVGRIISELSNPCLECKCTEIGVQCRALKC